uniref:Uncharacterized protein n=1 Tax=Oryza sativa subsp. japonica TaxID=39947 RepID=Q6H4H1_ORYSJ|nr:hypothetical protein [Oryza sativa Japonica Group]
MHHLFSSNSGRLPFFSSAGDTPTPAGSIRVRVWGWGEEGWLWTAENRRWAVDYGGRWASVGGEGKASVWLGGGRQWLRIRRQGATGDGEDGGAEAPRRRRLVEKEWGRRGKGEGACRGCLAGAVDPFWLAGEAGGGTVGLWRWWLWGIARGRGVVAACDLNGGGGEEQPLYGWMFGSRNL